MMHAHVGLLNDEVDSGVSWSASNAARGDPPEYLLMYALRGLKRWGTSGGSR